MKLILSLNESDPIFTRSSLNVDTEVTPIGTHRRLETNVGGGGIHTSTDLFLGVEKLSPT
jgi:hypothetical protein